jgi:DNA topoisomerase IA
MGWPLLTKSFHFLKEFNFEMSCNSTLGLTVQVRGAKTLIIWTDCDREGENIGMEVLQV